MRETRDPFSVTYAASIGQRCRMAQNSVLNLFHQLLFFCIWVLIVLLSQPCPAASRSNADLPPEIVSFITNKQAQAQALVKKLDLKVSPDAWDFFRTAQTKSTSATTNAFNRLMKRAGQY